MVSCARAKPEAWEEPPEHTPDPGDRAFTRDW